MQYKTHLAVTYAIALPMLVSSNDLTIENVVVLGIGAIFPDIDHPNSFIGKRMPVTSGSMKKLFGHRGIVHSLVGAVFFTMILRGLLIPLNLPSEWGTWFLMGFLAHLIEDSFSRHGIAWLQPFYNRNIQFGFKQIYYTTGGSSEWAIFIIASAIIIYQILHLNVFSHLIPIPEINNVVDHFKNAYFA